MTVNRHEPQLDLVITKLQDFSRVSVEHDHGIVSLVGTDLWKEASFTARVFTALRDVPVRMISLGSSDINLSVVVPQTRIEQAITLLHDELFSRPELG
jgi:aspartate kinase